MYQKYTFRTNIHLILKTVDILTVKKDLKMARFVLLLMVSLFIISEIPSIESMTRMDDGKLNNLIAFRFIYENVQ